MVRNRVKVRDTKRPRNQGAGSGTAPGTNGDPFVFSPVDKVLHDKEIARKAHAANDIELHFKPFLI